MVFTNVAEAVATLPELKLPVLMIGLLNDETVFSYLVKTEPGFRLAADLILFSHQDVMLVVTSIAGDDPRL